MWRGPSHPLTSITGGHRCSRCTRAHTHAHSYTATGRVVLEEQGSKYKCKHRRDILALENKNAIYAREAAAPLFQKISCLHRTKEVWKSSLGEVKQRKSAEKQMKSTETSRVRRQTEWRIKKKQNPIDRKLKSIVKHQRFRYVKVVSNHKRLPASNPGVCFKTRRDVSECERNTSVLCYGGVRSFFF